jgi:hypothetical protein
VSLPVLFTAYGSLAGDFDTTSRGGISPNDNLTPRSTIGLTPDARRADYCDFAEPGT